MKERERKKTNKNKDKETKKNKSKEKKEKERGKKCLASPHGAGDVADTYLKKVFLSLPGVQKQKQKSVLI